MYAVRRFAVRHAAFFESVYKVLERVMVALDPMFERIGYQRVEKPMAMTERVVKGFLFDCKMCGQCVLSSTGMSCPMNCPKNLRNGPCGGVRDGGFCEVKPWMRCVWVEAWDGSGRMREGRQRILVVQPPVDRSLEGSSAWLRVSREKAKRVRPAAPDPAKASVASAFKRARDIEPASAPLAAEPKGASQTSTQHTSVRETR